LLLFCSFFFSASPHIVHYIRNSPNTHIKIVTSKRPHENLETAPRFFIDFNTQYSFLLLTVNSYIKMVELITYIYKTHRNKTIGLKVAVSLPVFQKWYNYYFSPISIRVLLFHFSTLVSKKKVKIYAKILFPCFPFIFQIHHFLFFFLTHTKFYTVSIMVLICTSSENYMYLFLLPFLSLSFLDFLKLIFIHPFLCIFYITSIV